LGGGEEEGAEVAQPQIAKRSKMPIMGRKRAIIVCPSFKIKDFS
jgi:hypothetical protein